MIHKKLKNIFASKPAVLFLGVFVLFGVAYVVPTEPDVVIKMTKSGFVPEEVTIKQGQTIRFLNTDTLTHWPAIHAHPTHTRYPDSDIRKCGTLQELVMFDACRPVEAGESYNFTFSEAGTWGYHDHIISRYTGRVYVEPVEGYRLSYKEAVSKGLAYAWKTIDGMLNIASNPATLGLELTRSNNYTDSGGKTNSYTPEELASNKDYDALAIMDLAKDDFEIRRAVYQLGVKRTLEKLTEESEDLDHNLCHQEAHFVGRAAYDIFGVEAFSDCTLDCHSGCYHGAMERLFSDSGSSEVLNIVEKECSSMPTFFGRYQCFHGVGHGVLALSSFDLVGALDTCKDISSSGEKEGCYGGVFMENRNASLGESVGYEGHVTDWLSWDDLFFPCNTDLNGDSDARDVCYNSQAGWMQTVLNYDQNAVISECMNAPEDVRGLCYRGVGRNGTHRDPLLAENVCGRVPEAYYSECILSASKGVIDYYGPNLDGSTNAFCAGFTNQEAKDLCYKRFIRNVPDFFATPEGQKQMCVTMDEPYQSECVRSL